MASQFKCFEQIPDLLGIKTNISGFRCGFGKCDFPVSEEKYNNCLIKVRLEAVRNSKVFNNINLSEYTEQFRSFRVKPGSNSLLFEKKIAKTVTLKFFLTVDGNNLKITVGKPYLKFVKGKMMYIHSIEYILFDIVSLLFLKNGFTTLYCSASRFKNGKGAVFSAAPGTGKSLTVLKLKRDYGAEIIAEDMAVTDGEYIYGAPFTNLYRDYKDKSLTEFKNAKTTDNKIKADVLAIFRKGAESAVKSHCDIFDKLLLVNRYSLGYYYSPTVRVLDFYFDGFSIAKACEQEEKILKTLLSNTENYLITEPNSLAFSSDVYPLCSDEKR